MTPFVTQEPGEIIDGNPEPLPESSIRNEAPEGVAGSAPRWRLREGGPSSEFLLAAGFLFGVFVLFLLFAARRRDQR